MNERDGDRDREIRNMSRRRTLPVMTRDPRLLPASPLAAVTVRYEPFRKLTRVQREELLRFYRGLLVFRPLGSPNTFFAAMPGHEDNPAEFTAAMPRFDVFLRLYEFGLIAGEMVMTSGYEVFSITDRGKAEAEDLR